MWGRTAFGLLSHCESAGGESWHVTLRSSRSSSATCAAKNPTGLVYVSSSSSLPHNRNLPMSSSAHHTGETQEGLAVLKNLVYSLYRTPPPPTNIFLFLNLLLVFKRVESPIIHQLCIWSRSGDVKIFTAYLFFCWSMQQQVLRLQTYVLSFGSSGKTIQSLWFTDDLQHLLLQTAASNVYT